MSDSSEGIISLPVPSPPGGGPPGEEALGRRAQGAEAGARNLLPDLAAPPPGTLWAEDGAAAAGPGIGARAKGGGRRTAVTYVINEASQGPLLAAESGALQSLREACEVVGAALETLHFGKLDFGETAVLDRFYNAGENDLPGAGGGGRRASGSARLRPRLPWPRPARAESGAAGAGAALPRRGVSSGRGAPGAPPLSRASVTAVGAAAVGTWRGESASEPVFFFLSVPSPSRPPPHANVFWRRNSLSANVLWISTCDLYLWIKHDLAVFSQSSDKVQGCKVFPNRLSSLAGSRQELRGPGSFGKQVWHQLNNFFVLTQYLGRSVCLCLEVCASGTGCIKHLWWMGLNKELAGVPRAASSHPRLPAFPAIKLSHLHWKVWWPEVVCYDLPGPISKNNNKTLLPSSFFFFNFIDRYVVWM